MKVIDRRFRAMLKEASSPEDEVCNDAGLK